MSDCYLTPTQQFFSYIVLGMTRLGLEPTIYRTQGEHANHYTTDMVDFTLKYQTILIIAE